MSEYVYRATAAASDRSSNSGSITRRARNQEDQISSESLSAIDASMSLLQVASNRQLITASSGLIDSRGGQQHLEQASSVFGVSGPQFSRRPDAEQAQRAHLITRREHIVLELQRIVTLLVGNRSTSSSSPERQNTSSSPRRQNTLTGSVVISQNNSFASAAVPSGSLGLSSPGDTTGRQDSVMSTTTTSTPAAVISHQKLPFSMERLLIETASALQKELLMLHPGRPRDLYDNNGGGVQHNQRGGPRRPPRSSRSSAGVTTEALLDRSRSLRGHAECYDNVSGGLSSSYASALRHPEHLANNSTQLIGGGVVGRTVSFASNDSSLGSGSGSALTSFEDTVVGASGTSSRKQNRSFAEFPKVQQQELIAPYRQDVRQVIETMLASLKNRGGGGGGSGGKTQKSTSQSSERSGLVQQSSMTTLLTKRSSFTSAAWEELSGHESHQHFADHIDDFPYFRQYEPRGSFPEPAKYAPLGHASRGPSNATTANASPAASPRPSSTGISVPKRNVGGNEGKSSPADSASSHHRKDSKDPTPAGGREELREEATSKGSDTIKGMKRTNPFSNAVRQLYRWNHEIIQEERLAARTVAEATSSMSPFRLILHRGEEDNYHHRDSSGDSCTSAIIDGQTPTVSPQLLAGSGGGDENQFAVPPLRTSAISRSSSSVLSMPPETPTMEAVFVEEVRVASHAFGLLDGAEDDALFSEVSSPQGSLTGESFVGGNGRGTGGTSRNVAAQRKLFFPLSSAMLQSLISSVDAAAASSSSEGASYPPIPAHRLLPSASVGMLHPRLLDNVVYYLWHTALTYPQHPLRKALTWFVEQRLDYLTSAMRVAGIRVADVQLDSAVANPFDVSDLIGQSVAVSSRPSSKVNRQTTTTSAAAPNDMQEIHRFYSFPNGAKGMWETDRVAFVAALSETFAEKMFVARSIPVTMDLPDPWSNLSPLSTSFSVAAACAAVLVEERDRALILLKGSTTSISSLTSRLTVTNDKNATSSSGGDKAPLEDAGKAVAALRSSIASKFTSLKSTLRRARSNSSLLSESKPSLTTSGSTTVNSARTYQDFVLVRPSGAAVLNHRSRSPSPTDPDGGDLDEIDDDDRPMNPGVPRAGGGALTIHSLESSTRASVTSATATTTTTLLDNDVIPPGSNQLGASPLGGCVLSVSIGPVFRETVPASLDGLLYWLILDAVLCLHFGSRQVRDDVLLAAATAAVDAKSGDDRPLMYKFRNGVRIFALLDDVISTAESHQPTTTTPVGAEPVVKTLCVTDAGLAMLTGLALELDRFVEAWITRVLSYASPSSSTGAKSPFATTTTSTERGGAIEPPNWVNPDSETERLISFLQHTFQIVEHVATYSTIEFRFRRSLPSASSALIDSESSKEKEEEVGKQLSGPLHPDDEMERQMQHQNRSHDAVGADVLLPVAVCLCSRLKWKHVLLPVMQWIDGTPWYASPVGGKGASAYTYMTFTAALSAAVSASSDDYD